MTPEQIQQAAEKTAQENPEIMFPCVTAYETGYSAGFHAALECDTVKGMVEALKEMLRWTDGNCKEYPTTKSLSIAEKQALAAIQEYEQLIKPA